MGGVIDGMPAGVSIDMDRLQRFVNRRRPGQTAGASARDEKDKVEILSGLWQGKTLGTPIGFVVRNTDARSADYEGIAACYRPNHADFTWEAKYGIRDPRGGGRASARETVARVVAGGIALQALQSLGIIPGAEEVDLKKAAKVSGNKKVDLIPMKELLPTTGYIRGGCSPVGMKKPFPTYFDETCILYDYIYVSAGVRGLQFKIDPQALVDFVGAETVDLIA